MSIQKISFALTVAGAMFVSSFGSSAFAAGCSGTLSATTGSFMINHGQGFSASQSQAVVGSNDLIMAKGESTGVIRFADGSTTQVLAGSEIRVPQAGPCGTFTSNGIADTDAGASAGYLPYVAVAGFVAVGVGIAILASNQKSGPVSP